MEYFLYSVHPFKTLKQSFQTIKMSRFLLIACLIPLLICLNGIKCQYYNHKYPNKLKGENGRFCIDQSLCYETVYKDDNRNCPAGWESKWNNICYRRLVF
uniref:Uncharacterized protein n=1 Tax=Megaselia scalaris TaxID=36166 RepID=T1GVI9_MEGSC